MEYGCVRTSSKARSESCRQPARLSSPACRKVIQRETVSNAKQSVYPLPVTLHGYGSNEHTTQYHNHNTSPIAGPSMRGWTRLSQ